MAENSRKIYAGGTVSRVAREDEVVALGQLSPEYCAPDSELKVMSGPIIDKLVSGGDDLFQV